MLDWIAFLLVITALFSYINHTVIKLPPTIGVMALTLAASALIVVAGLFDPVLARKAESFVRQLNFDQAVLHGMLGFLLFAGALHINLGDLARWTTIIVLLATVGVVLSTFLVGGAMWLILGSLGIPISLAYCLLFGALISPTDPIAVLGLLKQVGVPKSVETKIAGESLFNDGIGVVVFLVMLGFAVGGHGFEATHLVHLLLQEVLGGVAFGLAIGSVVYVLMRSIDSYHVEILLSLALVAGGYALAEKLHVSAPLAVVVAGLLIGNHGRSFAMSPTTVEHLDNFWEMIDEILNGILFVLIGLEVLIVQFNGPYAVAAAAAIAVTLLARLVSVGLPVAVLRRWRPIEPGTVRTLTWGGLRGGISVALALSLPAGDSDTASSTREIILCVTYAVVVFSILVQGLTLGPLARRWFSNSSPADESSR